MANKYANAGNGKRVFVKYANRKLYDIETSKYVNIRSLGKLSAGGFVVIDYDTGADITSEILLSALTLHFSDNPADFEKVRDELVTKFLSN
jgi:polyhydroxyalkanoate synthesis regulator protein